MRGARPLALEGWSGRGAVAAFRRTGLLVGLLVVSGMLASLAQAQALTSDGGMPHPYGTAVRQQFYEQLRRHPGKALGWELLAPGAGHVYAGFHPQAIAVAAITLSGAALWTAGAIADRPALWWAGAGTFAAARTYGLVSAPVCAVLLNAALRRQLGIRVGF